MSAHVGGGQWCKKIRGLIVYFDPLSDPQAALDKWLAQKDDLLAGRKPREATDGLTMADAANRSLSAKRDRVVSGERTPHAFGDYHATCQRLVDAFGKNRAVTIGNEAQRALNPGFLTWSRSSPARVRNGQGSIFVSAPTSGIVPDMVDDVQRHAFVWETLDDFLSGQSPLDSEIA